MDEKLGNQYTAILTNLGQPDAAEDDAEEPEVVKLFDD